MYYYLLLLEKYKKHDHTILEQLYFIARSIRSEILVLLETSFDACDLL